LTYKLALDVKEAFEDIEEALQDKSLQEGLRRASMNAQRKVLELLEKRPELRDMAKMVKEAKQYTIDHLDELIEQALKSLEMVNAKPYLARTPEEARMIIGGIVGSGKLVVMSKTMAGEEVGLREHLESLGNEVWETDLGQLLVQLEDGKPMHTIAPAVHMTREAAIRLIKEKLGGELPPDASVEEAVYRVREFLREKFTKADIGISGANALAADTGSIVLVENEGNIRLVTGLPPVHIALVPVDKLMPTLQDAIRLALVQAAYAGLYPPTYLNIISGPSSTADIEIHRVYGAHGPRELHVVLLDNGRINASKHPVLREQLRCIRCGRCQFECPVWIHTANKWGGPVYGGPMGINWTAITLDEEYAGGLATLCLTCARCDEACPVEIPLSRLLRYLKGVYMSKL